VVADLPQLHQDIHHTHEASPRQGCTRAAPGHKLLVQLGLPSTERAHDDVLEFPRQLFLDVLLEAPKEEGPHDGVQSLN